MQQHKHTLPGHRDHKAAMARRLAKDDASITRWQRAMSANSGLRRHQTLNSASGPTQSPGNITRLLRAPWLYPMAVYPFVFRSLVMFLCLLGLSMPGQAKDKGVNVVITDPYAEMHTGPGRGHPVFHVVEKGEQVRIIKRRTDWYRAITSNGKDGWIHRDELRTTLGLQGEQITFTEADRDAYQRRSWELGFGGGTFSGSRALNAYVGYHFTSNLSTELRFTQAFGSFSNSKLVALNILHEPFPDKWVSPFFTLGSGVTQISPSSDIVQAEDRENSILTVGGGFLFYVSRSFLFRVEYNDHTLLTERENNEEVDEWKAGFSVFF